MIHIARIFLSVALVTALIASFASECAADDSPSATYAALGSYGSIRKNNANKVLYIKSIKKKKDRTGVVQKSFGTGFLLTDDGHVLTASHVVLQPDIDTLVDTMASFGSAHNHAYPLQFIKRDVDAGVDAALLQLPNTVKELTGVHIGNSKNVPEEAELYVLGFPTPLQNLNSGIGHLSSKLGPNGWWVTSLPLNRGNSGGPIFDIGGNVIAMAIAGADESQSITYAMPIGYAKGLIDMVAIDTNSLRLQTAENKKVATQGFAFYKAVDHNEERTFNEQFCLPKNYKVTEFDKKVATQSGAETTILVEPTAESSNCVTVTSLIKGFGVEQIGPITTEYKGRGWIGGKLLIRGEKAK